jgi:hypothetical protein
MPFEFLKRVSLVYLATPYTRYPQGIRKAFEDASRLAGKLIDDGVNVFSPIVHSHPIAIFGRIDPLSHAIWTPRNEPFINASDTCLVGKFESWDKSDGITYEIDRFKTQRKKIYYIDPWSMEVSPEP